MKSVFDKSTRDELIVRINSLDENSTALWGRMNINQMLKHSIGAEELFTGTGKLKFKRSFIGRVFGKVALKGFLKDDSPVKRNMPTLPEIKITQPVTSDITAEKKKWIASVEEYAHYSKPDFIHPFFGKMTKEQLGYFAYKHIDHHLRQFNS